MNVNGLPDWANTSCVSINDVIEVSLYANILVNMFCSDILTKERFCKRQGDVVAAILSNYMVDIDWLMSGEFSHILFVEFFQMISSFVYVYGGSSSLC